MSHMKNLRMFQLSDTPPKLDSWQDYFVQTKQGADEDYDFSVGKDILGYRQAYNPETVVIHQYRSDALWDAFNELTTKERDIISLHLGFCMECFRTINPQTFDDLADLYQYTAADSVMKLYHRALRKLRSKLGTKE